MTKFGAKLAVALGLLCSSLPLLAHHSFAAEYDSKKTITVHGVVQKVAWVNPHAYVWVDVKDERWQSGHLLVRIAKSERPDARRMDSEFAQARR